MRAASRLSLLAVWFVSSASFGYPQINGLPSGNNAVPAAPSSGLGPVGTESTASDIRIAKLDFETQPAIPGVPASAVFISPILCSTDGIPFVDFPQPPDYMSQTIYSLDPKGGHAFSAYSVPGLFGVNFQSYFVSESIIGILVNATTDDKKAPEKITIIPGMPPRDVYPGEHHNYLVEFDKDGNYKATLDLPPAYHFRRLAALPDDSLVALAYDRANAVSRLFRLDSGGRITGSLQIPAEMEGSPDLVAGQSGDLNKQINAESSLSWWLFAAARKRIILYQAHSKSPVLEVGAGGVVREVPLQSPKGYVLDDFISANDRWIVRYRKEDISTTGAIDTHPQAKNFAIYDVDPNDGSLRTQIDPGTVSFPDIACEQDGVFTAFSMGDGKIIRKTAELPR